MEVMVNAFMGKYCLFVSHDFPGKSSGLLCIKAADFRRLSGNVILSACRRSWQDVNGDNEQAGFFAYGVAYPPADSNKCAIGSMPFAVKVLPHSRQKGVKTAFSRKLPFSFQAAGDSFLDLFIRMTPHVAA